MRFRNKIFSMFFVIVVMLNVIEKFGVGRSRRRLFMYSVSGVIEDVWSLLRNVFVCCVWGICVLVWMIWNVLNWVGGKLNLWFVFGGNFCVWRKFLLKLRRKRSIEVFVGSIICNLSNEECMWFFVGMKCILFNILCDIVILFSLIESVCMYSFTN